ncbi:alpha/beta hydrolase, partial [Lactobacillus sp. XV13L]|nr:alpha/beta hydrolase [Lactobacillus sp. XV13L]
FLHGWGSSVNAERQMTSAARKAGATSSVTQAIVNPRGGVKLVGQIPANAHNPIVEVGFQDNRNADYHEDGRWLKNVILKLQRQYHIKNINLVGHSMGNMAIVYYLLDNAREGTLPKLRKQVDIAGHFNGII